jgi:hypothetical protein
MATLVKHLRSSSAAGNANMLFRIGNSRWKSAVALHPITLLYFVSGGWSTARCVAG